MAVLPASGRRLQTCATKDCGQRERHVPHRERQLCQYWGQASQYGAKSLTEGAKPAVLPIPRVYCLQEQRSGEQAPPPRYGFLKYSETACCLLPAACFYTFSEFDVCKSVALLATVTQ